MSQCKYEIYIRNNCVKSTPTHIPTSPQKPYGPKEKPCGRAFAVWKKNDDGRIITRAAMPCHRKEEDVTVLLRHLVRRRIPGMPAPMNTRNSIPPAQSQGKSTTAFLNLHILYTFIYLYTLV